MANRRPVLIDASQSAPSVGSLENGTLFDDDFEQK
jgi:hypothetical protein